VVSLKFLEHHVPLWGGQRHTRPRLNLRDINTTKDPALYRPSASSLARLDSKLERHMSEGELAGGWWRLGGGGWGLGVARAGLRFGVG
jgi:hypothetical protein